MLDLACQKLRQHRLLRPAIGMLDTLAQPQATKRPGRLRGRSVEGTRWAPRLFVRGARLDLPAPDARHDAGHGLVVFGRRGEHVMPKRRQRSSRRRRTSGSPLGTPLPKWPAGTGRGQAFFACLPARRKGCFRTNTVAFPAPIGLHQHPLATRPERFACLLASSVLTAARPLM